MSTIEMAVVLLGAGVLAGVIGSGGGVSSLISYPALLAVGVPPLPANIVNLVAGVAIGPGSAISSRRELTDTRTVLVRLLPLAAVGALVGAALLLVTPPGVFAEVVPFLVLSGSVVLALQPTVRRWTSAGSGHSPVVQSLAVGVVSIYGGYFGAGSGVMLLAAMLILVDPRVPRANAMKNLLLGVISVVAAAVFVATGPVRWSLVLPLSAGLLVGSALGPIAVRRLPPDLVRWVAAVCGLVLAVYLWVRPS